MNRRGKLLTGCICSVDLSKTCSTSPSVRSSAVAALVVCSLLTGCALVPIEPTLTLNTAKSPEQSSACVVPRLQGQALAPVVVEGQRRYRIVVPSAMVADDVIESYRAKAGGRVFVYERGLLRSGIGRVTRECV